MGIGLLQPLHLFMILAATIVLVALVALAVGLARRAALRHGAGVPAGRVRARHAAPSLPREEI